MIDVLNIALLRNPIMENLTRTTSTQSPNQRVIFFKIDRKTQKMLLLTFDFLKLRYAQKNHKIYIINSWVNFDFFGTRFKKNYKNFVKSNKYLCEQT